MKFQKYPPELLQKIKDTINIIDVIGEHVVLKKSGANFTGLCPFHSERSPSFSVSEQKQLYHCYGCKKGGDLVSFVMEINGIDFPEALQDLADRARVALPKLAGEKSSDDPEVQKLRQAARDKIAVAQKLNRFVAAFYHHTLGQNAVVQNYFRTRGIAPDSDLAKSFYIGAAPAAWDSLSKHLIEKKAPLPLAIELGLIRESPKGKSAGVGYFDMLRNRAIFPIIDTRGKVAGFGGRSLPGETQGDGPKYLNSSDSILFQKSKIAYGLYQAQKHIREKNEVILVEGYFDVLALHCAGFENVVATCGTALTPEHLHLLKKFCSKITLLFDGDKAGISATERAMELGLTHGFVLHGASLPLGRDPDEVLFDQKTGLPTPQGREEMQAILAQSKPILDSRLHEAAKYALLGDEQRTVALKKVGQWLHSFADSVGREVRIQSVMNSMNVTRILLEQAMGGKLSKRPLVSSGAAQGLGKVITTPGRSARTRRKLTQGERILLMGFARGGGFAAILGEMRDKMPPGWDLADLFDHEGARDFIRTLLKDPAGLERLREAPEAVIPNDLDTHIRSTLTEALVSENLPFQEDEFRLSTERGQARSWARFSQQIKAALEDAEAKKDAQLQAKLMQEYLDVQRKMKEFTSFYDEA